MDYINTFWVIFSALLVWLMVFGVAFFYSGLAPERNAVNTLKMSFVAAAIIPIIWWIFGSSLAFSGSNPFFGNISDLFLSHQDLAEILAPNNIPFIAFIFFQMMFATLSPAIISGSVVGRMSFRGYCLFIILWSIIVYSTVAHWLWSEHGWLASLGVMDFAGGLVVHTTAGVSALTLAIILKPRKYTDQSKEHHNIPFVLLGVTLIWFGWFGFNAGSTLNISFLTVVASLNTLLATSSAIIIWVLLSWFEKKQSTIVGTSIATVVGLVAITPAAGFVPVWSSVLIGAITSVICYYSLKIQVKFKHKVDDVLDVFVAHGLSGIIGSLLTAVFASKLINPGGHNGLIYGNFHVIGIELIAIVSVVVFSALATYLIAKFIMLFGKLRVSDEEEKLGLDLTQHNEVAYSSLKGYNYLQAKVLHKKAQRYRQLKSAQKLK